MERSLRANRVLIAVLVLALAAAGCSKAKVTPQSPVAPTPPAPPSVVTPPPATTPWPPPPSPPPAPWTGPGLATPYINQQGELELVYGDSRGTVKLGTGKGTVDQAVLAPNREQLVYVVGDRIYHVSIASGKPVERELTEAADYWPVGALAWSPCSQYLMVDAGSSATRGLLLLKPSTGDVIGSCGALDFAWSPTAPSRLAVGMFSDEPLTPSTELDRTADLVIVDLPSGRMTTLAHGGAVDYWDVREWTSERGLVARHGYVDSKENHDEVKSVSVPARSATTDDATAGTGPLPAGMAVTPEVDFRGQLLLVDSQGVTQRQLTDVRDGRVLSTTMTADGSLTAYAWLAKGENIVRIKTVTCPGLVAGEMPLALSDAERRTAEYGYGPQILEFAPGSGRVLLARYLSWGGDDRVQVYDLSSAKLLVDKNLWMPIWVPGGDKPPRLVAGALLRESSLSDPVGVGLELSLIALDVTSGNQTVLKRGTSSESWWPLRFSDPTRVICLLNTTQPGEWKVAEVTLELPQ